MLESPPRCKEKPSVTPWNRDEQVCKTSESIFYCHLPLSHYRQTLIRLHSSQTTSHNNKLEHLNIPLTCSPFTYTSRPLALQEPPELAKPHSTPLFVLLMKTAKRLRGGLGIVNGSWFCSRPFIFYYPYTSEIHLYSNAVHISRGGPPHYTVFGFSERRGGLEQGWAMHVDEEGSSSYNRSKKRYISWKDITHLFVRILLPQFLYALFTLFFKGWLGLAMRGDNKSSGVLAIYKSSFIDYHKSFMDLCKSFLRLNFINPW